MDAPGTSKSIKRIVTPVNVEATKEMLTKCSTLSRDINWTTDLENHLFKAMSRKRAVWVNAHFSMASIMKIFNASSGLNLTADDIWAKLNTLYKIDVINQNQINDLPKSFRERKDFDLTAHPQFKKKIEPLNSSTNPDPKEVKADVPAVVESKSSKKPTKKAVVRQPRKPKVPVSVPVAVVNRPVKPRKVTSKPANVVLPAKSRRSRKVEVKPKPVSTPTINVPISKPTTAQKKPGKARKTSLKPDPIPIATKPIPAKPIPAKPISEPVITNKKRNRSIKRPTLHKDLSPPPPPAKKRRSQGTATN